MNAGFSSESSLMLRTKQLAPLSRSHGVGPRSVNPAEYPGIDYISAPLLWETSLG